MAAQIFQHAAGEIAHVDEGRLRQGVEPLHRRPPRWSRCSRRRGSGRWRAPRRCRGGSRRSRPSRRRDARSRSCRGSKGRRRCRAAGSRSCLAISSPPGDRDGRCRHRRRRHAAPAIACTASVISRRGTGLIAGSPTAIGRPGLVTVPTPRPARKLHAAAGRPAPHVAMISAPWVTSGSSPASLMMPASPAVAQRLAGQGKARRLALGQRDGHGIGELAGQQRGIGRGRGGGGAGAGGPAAAQVLSLAWLGALDSWRYCTGRWS